MTMIGIDLGTTNSLGAVYRNGHVEFIPTQYNSFLTPSVVSVDEKGHIVVGEIAKARLVTAPDTTVASFKKNMGEDAFYTLGNQTFTSEVLSSFIIRSIVEDARRYLNEPVDEVIISVPAYFNDKKRVATKRAGALAGVKVERIINEPSAAALAAYYTSKQEEMYLVFDFGGGTLDVSIVDCFDTMVEIISVSGDNHLGGDSFHEVMVDAFIKEHRIEKEMMTSKEKAILYKQAEVCKRQLTTQKEATMSAFILGETYTSTYTNERLLQESGAILNRIRTCLSHALHDAGLSIEEICGVIMVGGSSKMPLIKQYIRYLFHKEPVVETDCDYLIAKGLGIVCAIKQREPAIKDYILTDICPFSLGVEVYNEHDPDHGLTDTIIARNSVLPCSRVQRFYTSHDHQKQFRIHVLQGEHRYAIDNLSLGEMLVEVPKGKKGIECADIRFTYDLNGILMVDVTIVSNHQTYHKIFSNHMNQEEIEAKAKQLECLKVHPKDVSENRMVYERLLALYEEVPVYQREFISSRLAYFDELLRQQNTSRIYKYRLYLLNIIQQLENQDPFSCDYDFEMYEEEGDDNTWIN